MPDRHGFDKRAILSEEIARLPEKYRAPIVLCYLGAMSYEEAAALLGATNDRVRGRLARARKWLRKRLSRRGVEIRDVFAAAYPSIMEVAPQPRWVKATARAVMDFAAGKAVSSGIISQIVDPTRHCIHMSPMSLKRDDRLNDCVVRLN
jgi:Sigma-70, region 4